MTICNYCGKDQLGRRFIDEPCEPCLDFLSKYVNNYLVFSKGECLWLVPKEEKHVQALAEGKGKQVILAIEDYLSNL